MNNVIIYENTPCLVLSQELDEVFVLCGNTTKLLFITSKGYGMVCESSYGRSYFINGMYHREKGPALEFINGEKQWWENDLRHRLDGPAVEYADGRKAWYIEGKHYYEEEYYKKIEQMKKDGTYNL